VASPLTFELRCRQHEQDVAGPEHDCAELAGQFVVVAAAEGTEAAMAIHQALLAVIPAEEPPA